jgi:PleD family two-component response regulator
MGIVEARCDEDDHSILKRADEAMYQSKKGGRAKITFG